MNRFSKFKAAMPVGFLRIVVVLLATVTVAVFSNATFSMDKVVATEIGTDDENKVIDVIDISGCTVSLSESSFTYSGAAITPAVTVKDATGNIISSENYDVVYSDNINVGTKEVVINGKGAYTGSITKTFTIVPEKTKLTSAKVGGKSITLKWNKIKNQVTGYQIQYSTSSKFTESKTASKYIKDYKTVTKKISKLKSNKTYYVRIRTYKEVDGKKYYSSWSGVKTKKTGTGKFKKSGKKTYYVYEDGTKAKSAYVKTNKKTYYFNKNKVMVTGWIKMKDGYYYFDRKSGAQKKSCKVDGIKLNSSGKAKADSDDIAKIKTMIKARKIYLEIIDKNDSKSEQLKKCFDWVLKHPYHRYRILAEARESSTWTVTYANDVFKKGSGCCVSEACALAFLANECGYTAYVCDDTAHAWVEIKGKVYDTLFAEAKSYNKYYGTSYATAGNVRVNKTKI